MSVNPELDPWTAPIERIRSVLIQKGIISPRDTLDRSQLVALFHQHIRPQGGCGSSAGSPKKTKPISAIHPEDAYTTPSPSSTKVKEERLLSLASLIPIRELMPTPLSNQDNRLINDRFGVRSTPPRTFDRSKRINPHQQSDLDSESSGISLHGRRRQVSLAHAVEDLFQTRRNTKTTMIIHIKRKPANEHRTKLCLRSGQLRRQEDVPNLGSV